jgi:hypothetical protein
MGSPGELGAQAYRRSGSLVRISEGEARRQTDRDHYDDQESRDRSLLPVDPHLSATSQ